MLDHIERHYGVTKVIIRGARTNDEAVNEAAKALEVVAEHLRKNACHSTRHDAVGRVDAFTVDDSLLLRWLARVPEHAHS